MNKVILIGRVGQDPVVTDTVAKFSLATDFKKSDGEKVTEWHSIKVFGKLRDTVEKWVRKGKRVAVTGRLQKTEYEGKYYTDIIVEMLEIIDFPNKDEAELTGVTTTDPEGYWDIDKGQAFDDNDVPF